MTCSVRSPSTGMAWGFPPRESWALSSSTAPSPSSISQPGLKLALWPRADLAWDTGLARTAGSPTELSLGHNVKSSAEVDAVMEQAARAGGRIVKPAKQTFWGGYAGYFQDPDGHLWEVAWNPATPVEE